MTISTDAALRLCETVRMLRHLAIHLPDPVCLSFLAQGNDPLPEQASADVRATERAVNAAFARIGVHTLQYLHGGAAQLSSFEYFISRKICEALDYRYDHFVNEQETTAFRRLLKHFDFSGAVPEIETLHLTTRDNVSLSVHASTDRERTAIVLALPCGMPFDLCRDWFNALSERCCSVPAQPSTR